MNKKAFTVFEVLVVAMIIATLGGVLTATAVVGRNSFLINSAYSDLTVSTRQATARITQDLKGAYADTITITPCAGECVGDKIEFSLPIIDDEDIAGTYFTSGDVLKLGANSLRGAKYAYQVPAVGSNQGRLIREIPREPVCGNGSCEPGEHSCNCLVDCGGSCNLCFVAGTPILMADGTSKSIEEIKVGDTVLAFDQETGENKPDKVTEVFEHTTDNYLLINGHLKITSNHPLFHENKWVEVGLLKIGDELTKVDGTKETITSIEKIEAPVLVNNFTVNPLGTYYADGILAHNKPHICFLGGTPIHMADGTTKPIEDINVGDMVLAYDEISGKNTPDKVKEVFVHTADEYLVINNHIRVTSEHPFFIEGKWVKAGNLKIGDLLTTVDGRREKIADIIPVRKNAMVYNFKVNPKHTYYAYGYLVHNGKGGGGCFLAGTSILMADGTLKPIENIGVGDMVKSIDATDRITASAVTKLLVHPDTKEYLLVETADGKQLRVTREHRVLSGEDYKAIGTLTIDSPLTLLKDGELIETAITSMRKVKDSNTVYNFEVENTHTYFAEGYAVHNSKYYYMQCHNPPCDCPPHCKIIPNFFKSLFSVPEAFAEIFFTEQVIAPNIDSVYFTPLPDAVSPEVIKITITAKKNVFLLSKELEVTLYSAAKLNR
ncbi:polymorphic toxin-type HINT domain-containing protein [Candidatus Omnitrophota bacterium]